MQEAYNLLKDLEPTVPQEYILKGVVNSAIGQETGSVSGLFMLKIITFFLSPLFLGILNSAEDLFVGL